MQLDHNMRQVKAEERTLGVGVVWMLQMSNIQLASQWNSGGWKEEREEGYRGENFGGLRRDPNTMKVDRGE